MKKLSVVMTIICAIMCVVNVAIGDYGWAVAMFICMLLNASAATN